MKILRFNEYIKESVSEEKFHAPFDTVYNLKEVEEDFKYYHDLMKLLDEVGSYKKMVTLFLYNKKDSPEDYKKYMIYWFKLLYNKEFEDKYSEFLLFNKMMLRASNHKKTYDLEIKDLEELKVGLEKLSEKILKIPIDEFYNACKRFFEFTKKYKENKEKTKIVSEEDPYGEENWTDETDEDIEKKSWEESNF